MGFNLINNSVAGMKDEGGTLTLTAEAEDDWVPTGRRRTPVTQAILAVDDKLHMLRLLERIISERTPYSIVTTNSSLEAPKLLEKGSFDLILTDLKMPGMDGLDILRMVKEQDRLPVALNGRG